MAVRYTTLRGLLAGQDPEAPALEKLTPEGPVRLTYGELLAAAENYPVPAEQNVGIFCDNSIESVTAVFGLAGRRRLVLLDPAGNEETLREQIERAHAAKLIGHTDAEDISPAQTDGGPGTEILFFTSGTTESARAVMLDESRLCAAAYNGGSLLPLAPQDRLLSVLPHSHVFGFVCSLLWPLSCGAEVCLGRGLKQIFFDFAAYRPTASSLVPEMAGFLAARGLLNEELRLVLIGAGDCPDSVLAAVKARGIRVSFGYGLTETSSGIALSLGEDPRAMTVCPDYRLEIAEDGEIVVSCDTTLMKGYYEDPEATEKVLRDGRLYTGDLGRIEDGKLFLTGRKKEVLVMGDGTKVFLPAYERALAALLGEGSDFAVVQRPDKTLALYAAKPREIEEKIDAFNAGQTRSQRIAQIVYVDSIPRTATGKVRRYLLSEGE
ncbi:MAG: acyl--CoA ligase [Lachnospiraceae bacterium]|nr:acyl--CoA ligase [Lachnospiraceae bacterium]